MKFEDEDFFEDNTCQVNVIVGKILFFIIILPVLFIILSHFNIFHISDSFSVKALIIIAPVTLINTLLIFGFRSKKFRTYHAVLYERIQHLAKYTSLLSAAIILGYLGSHPRIGIYISYAIIAFLSCLYYNPRTTVSISIISWIIMLCSVYFKSVNRFSLGMTQGNSAFMDFVSFAAGFSIEFIFVFAIDYAITIKSRRTLLAAIERNEKLETNQLEFMEFVPNVLKKHEIITGFHVEHTVEYVRMICNQLKQQGLYLEELTPTNIALYSAAANLHDIGKIHIPDHILNTPKRYTPEEYEMMKKHPEIGREIIKKMPKIRGGQFNDIAEKMCYYHHERWDGTGYPNGIKGTEIPLCARIMAVADVTDALLSFRPYKPAFSIEKTMQIIEEGKGTQFEPAIADAIIQLAPLVMMYASECATKEKETIISETKWREQERESVERGRIISEEQQKELMHNS